MKFSSKIFKRSDEKKQAAAGTSGKKAYHRKTEPGYVSSSSDSPSASDSEEIESCEDGIDETSINSAYITRAFPDGRQVRGQSPELVDYFYQEIFVDRAYSGGGRLSPGDLGGTTIIDVGANNGFFSMWAYQYFPAARDIIAFEPIPPTFACAAHNTARHCPREPGKPLIHLRQEGVSDAAGVVTFTHYPDRSGISTMHALEGEARQKHLEGLSQLARQRGAPDHSVEFFSEKIAKKEEYPCNLCTLHQTIESMGVERVGLLKIDCERAEWNVLQGLHDKDWALIENIAIEVEDVQSGNLERILELLKRQGFTWELEEQESGWFCGVFAWRP